MSRLWMQFKFDNKSFWRNPAAAVFTFVFPLVFLFVFTTIFGDDEITTPSGESADMATFYIPSILALSIVNVSYTSLAMQMTILRDGGFLKQVYGTPLPVRLFIMSKVLHLVVIGLILIAIVLAFGRIIYDVQLPTNTLPAATISAILGIVTFSALGLAMTSLIPNSDAAPAIVNASILPLLFISDIFIPLHEAPDWLSFIGSLFPVYHLSHSLITAFDPFQDASGFEWGHLAALTGWGIIGSIVAARRFSWIPRI